MVISIFIHEHDQQIPRTAAPGGESGVGKVCAQSVCGCGQLVCYGSQQLLLSSVCSFLQLLHCSIPLSTRTSRSTLSDTLKQHSI